MQKEPFRVIDLTFLLLLLLSNIACSGNPASDSADRNQWQPHKNISGVLRRDLVGDPSRPGPFKYQLKITAGTRVAAHHHSTDVHVKVLTGSMFIIIGEPLEAFRAQRFAAGAGFLVPAHAWHDEWWDEETILEAEGVGPVETVNKDNGAAQNASGEFLSIVDHLVYATPDLNRGIEEIEKLIGVRAIAGGQHPGRGTRNALIALGPTSYLEIIAPDPDQPPPNEPRPFGIDGLKHSRLVTWVAKSGDLERLRGQAVSKGVALGKVRSGSRRRPDGGELVWRFTDPAVVVADGIVPFFIDWGESPHPAQSASKGATLVRLQAQHPDVRGVQGMLQHLGLDLPVNHGQSPALTAVIEGPRGRVELR